MKIKRLIGLLLVTVLLFTMVPMSALAKPADNYMSSTVKTADISSDNPTSDESANDLASNVNGIVKCPDGRWAMYKNGKVDTTCTTIAMNKYGWWRVKDGYVDFNANGIYKNQFGWWKTNAGKVTFKETGIYKNEYGWWRVVNSKVDFKANGIYKNSYGWWKTTNGRVTFDENGVFKNQYGWWYVKDSKVDFSFTGIASNSFGEWYINNGKVDFTKIGKVELEGKSYVIALGKVLFCLTPDEQEPSDPEERLELKSDFRELLANEEATVFFEAVGEPDQTVELYDGYNNFVGTMLDDGLNGDIAKDDGIYTSSIKITPQIGEKYRYYAKGNSKSNYVEISTFKISDFLDESELADDILSHIRDLADEYVISDSEEETAQSAISTYDKIFDYVTGLKKSKTILDCHFDGLTITMDLPSRSLFYIFEVDPNLLSGSSNVDINTISTFETFKNEFPTSVYDDAAKAIDKAFDSYQFNNNLDNNLDKREITLDALTSLSNNRVIIWNGHGAYDEEHHSYLVVPLQTYLVYGGEEYVTPEYVKYINDFKNGYLIDGGDRIGVTGDFFKNNYRDQPFNNTLFYVGVCGGAYDDYFCKSLLSVGVRTVLAFDKPVSHSYNEVLCKSFFDELIKKESADQPTSNTAAFAYETAIKNNLGTYMKLSFFELINHIKEKGVQVDLDYMSQPEAHLLLFGDKEFRLSDYDSEPYDPEPVDGLITEDDSPDNYGNYPLYYAFIETDDELGMLPPGKAKFENNVPESWQVNINNTRSDLRYHDSSLDEFDEQGRLTKVTYVSKNNPNRYLTFSRESDYRFDGSYIVKVHNHLADEGTDYFTYDPNSKRFLFGYWNFEYDTQGRLKRLFIEPGIDVIYIEGYGYSEKHLSYDEMIFSYEESNNALYQKYYAYKDGEKVYSGKVQIVNSNDSTILLEKKRLKRTGSLTERRLIIPDSFKGQSIMNTGWTYSYDERGNLTWCGGNTLRYELSY